MYGTYNQFIFKSIIANIHLEIGHPLKYLLAEFRREFPFFIS